MMSNRDQGSTDANNWKSKIIRKETVCILFVAGFALILIGLDIAVINAAQKSNIKESVDTVIKVQRAFNKLGMQLSTIAEENDKRTVNSLVIIEALTIVFHSPPFCILIFCLVFLIRRNRIAERCQIITAYTTLTIIGCMQISLVIARAIYVNKMQPPDSIEVSKPALLKSLRNSYKNDSFTSSGNTDSDTWNGIFIDFQCCAVNAVESTTNDFDLTPWCTTSGSCQETNSQIPKACCKGVNRLNTSAPPACHEYVNDGYYNEQGCADVWSNAVQNLANDNQKVYGVGISTAVIHVISTILSVCFGLGLIDIYKNNKKKRNKRIKNTSNYEEREKEDDIRKKSIE